VIHYEMPGSVVGYYQQVGRAGRALPSAHGVILYGTSELNTLDYFIKAAFPRPNDVDRVVGALDAYHNGLTREALQQVTRMQYQSLDRVLNTISKADPSPIAVADGVWTRTGQDLHPSYWTRVEHITRLRREEIDEMQRYVRLPFGQHMQFLVRTLGGDPADVTTPPSPPLVFDTRVAVAASTFDDTDDGSEEVRSFDPTVIKPRRQWPYRVGYKQYNQYGKIPREYQASRGKVLGALDDQAWTKHLYECRQRGTSISEDLIAECIAAISSWNPAPRPTWVTGIPSLRHPTMVSDFAKAIADGLGLPFHMVLERTADRPEQRTMQEHRKTDRGTNLDGAFGIATHAVPRGNVILIDDIVYSRWTMTIAAWLLRSHGAGQVHPFAVAQKIEQPSTEQPRWGGRRRWGR
jgi:ATP-dependent DNA helicase RecQ